MIKLLSPENNSAISLLTSAQREFILRFRAGLHTTSARWAKEESISERCLSDPATVLLRWRCDDPAAVMKVELSFDEAFPEGENKTGIASIGTIREENGEFFACVDNLMMGRRYYWRVNDESTSMPAGTFTTLREDARFIRAGIRNVRDIGGKVNEEGKVIRQGLIYRGSALEEDFYKPFSLSPSTRRVMSNDLKIKTEIDLRDEAVGRMAGSSLGETVRYRLHPIWAYAPEHDGYGKRELRSVFELLADEKNYPIYFHCIAGADRTGTIAFILNALLGLAEEDIILDYELTDIVYDRCWYTDENIHMFLERLAELYPGCSLPEKLRMLLRSTGLDQGVMDRIRDNLLE